MFLKVRFYREITPCYENLICLEGCSIRSETFETIGPFLELDLEFWGITVHLSYHSL